MEDITYIIRENFLLSFWEYWKLSFHEATAKECFEHFFAMQRDPDYLVTFIEEFISKYWHDIQAEKIGYDVIYKNISQTYFKDFFNEEKWKWESTPFYTLIDIIAEKVWDPYDFIEKRTWRQVMALIKGIIWNRRAGTPEWDKENRKMMNREIWTVADKEKITKAVDSAVADFINSNK